MPGHDSPSPGDGDKGGKPPENAPDKDQVDPTESYDPNSLAGPHGYGPRGFVASDQIFSYRVNFENSPTATAPAQQVDVSDRLDAHLDWSTFQFTEVGFGDTIIAIPAGSRSFSATVPITYNGKTFDVQIELDFDVTTGKVDAHYYSIDPASQLPPDALTGFLPAEDGTGRGMGYFSYTVDPRPGLATGTQIRNVAAITFDLARTITTDQISDDDPALGVDPNKQALNTIDAGSPSSVVSPLPTTATSPYFLVTWSGHDDPGGSGIATYDLYVSDNGSPFTLWRQATPKTSSLFLGINGHTYSFYSVATDDVGNLEVKSPAAEATTQVMASVIGTATTLSASANPSKLGDAVTFTAIVSPDGTSFGHPTGSVQFLVDGVPTGSPVALLFDEATFTTSALSVGSHAIEADYTSDNGVFEASQDLLAGGQEIDTADVAVSLVAASAKAASGQPVTFTITAAAVTAGLPHPTGTVTLFAGSIELDHATLADGTASITTSALPDGDDSITAVYHGDGHFSPGTSPAASVTVSPSLAVTSIAPISPDPRNLPVSAIDVTFNRPIELASFTPGALTLTDDAGSNLITPSVTIGLVSGTTYAISGLAASTLADGTYVLTVDASLLLDQTGNEGTGSLTTTWLMDATPPTSTVGTLPQATTSTSFTVSVSGSDPSNDGSTPADIASFAIYTSTDGGAFTPWTTVTPAVPSATFTGQPGHTYGFFSVATDQAGNFQPTPTRAQQTVQVVPPLAVASITPVAPSPRNASVSVIGVTLSMLATPHGFDYHALTLTDDGGPNLITSAVTVTPITSDAYAISGLDGMTTAEGNYTLTVDASHIIDPYGSPGVGSISISWLMDTTPPDSAVDSLPAQTSSTSFTVSVTGRDPVGAKGSTPSGVASYAIYESVDAAPFSLVQTVAPADPSTSFTGQLGHTYGFYSVATDNAGNVQPTPVSAQQTVQIISSLTVTSIVPVSPNPRNNAVSAIDVTFSGPVDVASLSRAAISLTDNGNTIALSGLSLSPVSGTTATYAIQGLAAFTAAEGRYSLTFNADGVHDPDGHAGTGSRSTAWLMDSTPPTSIVGPLTKVGTSLSFPVAVTGADPGGTPSGIASFTFYVSTNGGPWQPWVAVPTASTSGASASASATFTGQSNTSYSFYAIATDLAGNAQAFKPSIEAYTYLPDLTPPVTSVNPASGTNPSSVAAATGTFTLNLSGSAQGGKPLTYFQVFVGIDLGGGGNTQQVGAAIPAGFPDAHGVYHATITYQGLTDGTSHSYTFSSLGIDGAGLVQTAPASPVTFIDQSFTAPALQVTGLTVEHGAAERSYIRYLDVDFNEGDGQSNGQVTAIAGSLGTAVRLYKYDLNGTPGSKAAVSLARVTATVIDHAIDLDFGAAGVGGNAGSTAGDGYYELDVTTGAATSKHFFYRMLGDVTGDGAVDNADLTAIATEINLSSPSGYMALSGDVNGDGTVTATDATLATRAKGHKLGSSLKIG